MNTPCPLCGSDKYMHKPKSLYGHQVCKKCVNGFANRRQLAFVIDMIIIRMAIFMITFAIGLIVGMFIISRQGELSDDTMMLLHGVDLVFAIIGMLLITAKDGFGGMSPGKMITGVQVLDERTGRPIGFGASIKRNWVVLVPIMPLVIAVQC